ncbi:hypothetical protein KPH14_012623 [Odynerus spinipes]|uniref:PiggyBac transposable element-derived protein domain-containing protein n=1 Tax=Odynerus spinipes TaxID=1348599 RepID=A0AAD9REK9_9HYME|nr:hypothetical protein KPH14_012623 [Odynerus spinipes]
MEKNNYYDENIELSDSEDVFDFQVLEDIVEDIVDYNSDTSSSGSEIILPQRRRKIVIESESEESLEDLDEWRDVTEELDIPDRIHFSVSPKVIGPQIPTNIVQPIQYLKLFFTNELVNEIIKETNNYAENVLKNKEICSNSIWQTWRAVEEDEFWAFIGVIINMAFFHIMEVSHPKISTRITLHLYQQLLDRVPTAEGYHMHTDRYYTSIPLAEELRKMKCHLTGTIQTNRKGVPSNLKKPKLR